jgi:hypothetical protein
MVVFSNIYTIMSDNTSGFGETFLSKLKEQSFTIILLVGIMYYQNTIFTNQMNEYKKMINDKETILLKLTDDERNRLLEREKYLMGQRDEFVKDLKDGRYLNNK